MDYFANQPDARDATRSRGLADRRIDAELTAELIGHCLDTMPELPRSVFVLRHVDGLEVAAIGARLGMAVEDVERELARAIDVLIWGAS